MASKYLQKYPVPAGFQEILADFTRQVLRDQPPNIIQYAAKYFQMLEKGQKFQFNSKYNVSKDDKKYELQYNPKNAQDITKKASNIAARVQDSGKPVNTKPIPKQASAAVPETKVEKNPAKQDKIQKTSARASIQEQPKAAVSQSVSVLPPELIESVNNIFDQVDSNKNGYIQSGQLRKAVEYFAQQNGIKEQVNQKQIAQFMSQVDTNRDGKVSRKQFIEFVAQLFGGLLSADQPVGTQKTVNQEQVQNYMSNQGEQAMLNQMRQQVDSAFNEFDVDKSGYITTKQVKGIIQRVVGPNTYVNPSKVEQFMQNVDQNNDGKISRQELFQFVLSVFNQEAEEGEQGDEGNQGLIQEDD